MGSPLLIGIDLGTTNGKVACYDVQGRLQAEAVHGYSTEFPRPGWYEQEPADWLAALEMGLKEVVSELGPRASDVAGVAISSFGPGLVVLDQSGASLAPSPIWLDERCRPQGRRLVAAVGHGWIGLGSPLTGFPAKLMWALEERPDLMKRADQVADIKGFLLRWLTGQAITEPSSGPGDMSWWAPVFDYIDWPIERLPRVMLATESPGDLREEIARDVGLRPAIPVFAGLNDGAAATLGSGAAQLGDSVVTLATNGVARVLVSERVDPDVLLERYLFSWPFIDGLWVCGGLTRSGAASLQWLADLLGVPREPAAYDALLSEAAEVPPGSHGIVFLPYLAGRGTPEADPELRGGFINVGLEHGRADLARAVLEGVAFAVREIYDEFVRLGYAVGSLRLTGGGARSRLWHQIIADVLNQPVSRAGGDSTLGVAIVAAVGLGIYPNFPAAVEAMVHPIAHEAPDASGVAMYERAFSRYVSTRDTLLGSLRLFDNGSTSV